MAWKAINRNEPVVPTGASPVLSEAARRKIRSFFDRYESKRAVLLPALHVAQDALGHISWQAMEEIADLLELQPSDVMDTTSFYSRFWTHPMGKKVITVCRSISCEVMGSEAVLTALKEKLGIDEHQTTADGMYSLVTEECLAQCDNAPCLIINEKVHRRVKPEDIAAILADEDNDRVVVKRSDLFDAPPAETATGSTALHAPGDDTDHGKPDADDAHGAG
ncbi:MAG: NADH-quinone oxidoreductase subunit NuoE [Phycisphaerae bacterium]